MSDYTSTFTENTGDTIDTTDFSTEFDAIATASATKYDKAGSLDNHAGGVVYSGTVTATTSGTEHDYTSIPSWVKKIIVSFVGVSTDGTGQIIIQLGVSGTPETTSYNSGFGVIKGTNDCFIGDAQQGFFCGDISSTAGVTLEGVAILTLVDSSTNTWAFACNSSRIDSTPAIVRNTNASGTKSLAGTMDTLRITTAAGTENFDAGKVNILYEG